MLSRHRSAFSAERTLLSFSAVLQNQQAKNFVLDFKSKTLEIVKCIMSTRESEETEAVSQLHNGFWSTSGRT